MPFSTLPAIGGLFTFLKRYGGELIEEQVQVPIIGGGGGSTSGFAIPEAIVIARTKINVIHVQQTRSIMNIIIRNLFVKTVLPLLTRKISITLESVISSLNLETFVQGLTLKMRNEGVNINESES